MNRFVKSIMTLMFLPLLLLLNGCQSEDGFSQSRIRLVRIDIVAAPITTRGVNELTLAAGNEQPFEAIGHYSDGSSHRLNELSLSDWYTSDNRVGHFSAPGLFLGQALGSATVTVQKEGITSNAVSITVTEAVITEIQITPAAVNLAKGQTEQLTATAIYSDNSSSNISHSVTWTPVDNHIATITQKGELLAVNVGSTTVTASKNGIISNTAQVLVTEAVLTTIQITPAPVNVAKGQTAPLKATASYSDGTSSNITTSVTWRSFDPNIITINDVGLLLGVNMGNTAITATHAGITSETINVSVSAAVITEITVTPNSVNVPKEQTYSLNATATYSDGSTSNATNDVIWVALDTNIATVSSAGLLTGVNMGTTTVTAQSGEVTSALVNVSVTEAMITSIKVTPSFISVSEDRTQQLTATATHSDGTLSDVTHSVTWQPLDTQSATITETGLLAGITAGTTTLTATKAGITSRTMPVNVYGNLGDAYIDIFDVNDGKLFTSAPSRSYLSSINANYRPQGTLVNNTSDPLGIFTTSNHSTAHELCTVYNTKQLGGRSNWRLPERDELKVELFDRFGNMTEARLWLGFTYWSATPKEPDVFYTVNLSDGRISSGRVDSYMMHVTSCVSEP